MLTYTPLNLQNQLRAIGRGIVFVAATKWNGLTNLALTHLGDSEGDISVARNESYVHLTTPELSGQAKLKSYVEGEDPVVTIPLYVADPAVRAIITPVASTGGGYSRRRPVKERTLVIFPEELLYDEATDAYAPIAFDGTDWTVGGNALTTEQQRLLDISVWFWRGYFTRPPMPFKHGEAGKAVEQATFQVMLDATKPEGQMLYTVGDPADADIDIHPVDA